jgi:guanylate kinase
LARRLDVAREELSEAGTFDYLVVNDEVNRAAEEIARILQGSAGSPPRAE